MEAYFVDLHKAVRESDVDAKELLHRTLGSRAVDAMAGSIDCAVAEMGARYPQCTWAVWPAKTGGYRATCQTWPQGPVHSGHHDKPSRALLLALISAMMAAP